VTTVLLAKQEIRNCCQVDVPLNAFSKDRLCHAEKSFNEKGQWLMDQIAAVRRINEMPEHKVEGLPICSACFCDLHGVTKSLYVDCLTRVSMGDCSFTISTKERDSPKRNALVAWLHQYFLQVGDHDPTDGILHLTPVLFMKLLPNL
jgi:hypothetical protein